MNLAENRLQLKTGCCCALLRLAVLAAVLFANQCSYMPCRQGPPACTATGRPAHCPGSARASNQRAQPPPCQAAEMGWWGRGRVRRREGRDGVGGLAVRDGGSRSESSRPPCRNSRTIIQPRNPPPPPPPPLERQRMLRRTGEREGRRTGERKGRCTGEREGRRAEGTGGLASGGAGRPAHERTGRPAHERTGRSAPTA